MGMADTRCASGFSRYLFMSRVLLCAFSTGTVNEERSVQQVGSCCDGQDKCLEPCGLSWVRVLFGECKGVFLIIISRNGVKGGYP